MGPLDIYILHDDALKATSTGFELQFHSHWYRSLPLSCMQCKTTIDGNIIDEKDVYVEANGNKYPLSDIANLYNEWLFIQDAATLHVNHPPLQQGKEHKIEFKIDLFIPYIIVDAAGNTLLASSTVKKNLVCN
jgi:hypothetical protein